MQNVYATILRAKQHKKKTERRDSIFQFAKAQSPQPSQ